MGFGQRGKQLADAIIKAPEKAATYLKNPMG
jgi:hypothetical protein